MAITLEELLGSNMQATNTKYNGFPSYEDFTNRNNKQNVAQQPQRSPLLDSNYDYYAPRQASRPQTVEDVRAYNASQTYSAPQQSEFRAQSPSFIDNMYAGEQVLPQTSVSEEN